MNPLNVGSLPACQGLAENGIALKTDFYWHVPEKGEPELLFEAFVGYLTCGPNCKIYPAPSLAEVWRELPEGEELRILVNTYICNVSIPGYSLTGILLNLFRDVDRMIDLLIWVRERK